MNSEDVFEAFRFKVDPGQAAIRIDKFLMAKIEKISRNIIQNAIGKGMILVNDAIIKPSYKVRPGDLIQVFSDGYDTRDFEVQAEAIDLDIRYEDDDLIVIYKPPGLVVHPGVSNWSGTLVNGLVHYLENKNLPVMEGNEPDRPGLVHRIDKDTSGLMVVAKNEKAMGGLASQFYDHSINREYIAIVWGVPDPVQGTIDGNIGRHPKDRLKQFVFEEGEAGKKAITHYEVLEDLYYVSLVKCKLETGRTHQIRVHMAWKSHPLFNDTRYGGDKIHKGTIFTRYRQFVNNCFDLLPRHALHARSLGFIHPVTGKEMLFQTELPDDMQQVMEKWRHYVTHQKTRT